MVGALPPAPASGGRAPAAHVCKLVVGLPDVYACRTFGTQSVLLKVTVRDGRPVVRFFGITA